MQKFDKIILLSLMALTLVLLSAVSAADISDNNMSAEFSDDDGSLSDVEVSSIEDDCVLCSDPSSKCDDTEVEIEPKESEVNAKSPLKSSEDDSIVSAGDSQEALNESVHYVSSDNFTSYFIDGVLKEDFEGSVLVFNGEFADMGIIDVKSPNVTVIGNNSLLRNTVFCLESSNVMLTGLNFVLDQESLEIIVQCTIVP